ncbi:MAG: hypothetical protein JXR77_11000 [Lentisphaeria bacterium]|nr:hypothetical protein [Lentisphaeria bacterium]
MNLSDDRQRAIEGRCPQTIPCSVGILPAAWMKYRAELDRLVAQYPGLFPGYEPGRRDYDAVGGTYVSGEHVDAWGCVWSNVHNGMEAIVTGHPVKTREDIRTLQAPSRDIGLPHGFMFLRLTDLRGFEEMMLDFAEEPPELQQLIDVVLEYNLRQVDIALSRRSHPEMLYFGDDLGMQTSLPIHPETWRRYLKPCYAALFGRCRAAGHLVYFHSDGHIVEIIPDLVECGVTVINPQVRANGLENLARVCKGRVCVDLDLDRQLFPFASADQIDAHIQEAVETLGAPEGGLWLKAEVDPGIPLDNIAAIFAAMEKWRHRFSPQPA